MAPLTAVLIAFAAAAWGQEQQTNRSDPASSARVGVDVRPFVDASRPDWRTRGPRPLATVIWYPTLASAPVGQLPLSKEMARYFGDPDSGRFFTPIPVAFRGPLQDGQRRPLVLLSHGSTGLGLSLEWLAVNLAAHGYIVAAVNHHGNTIAEGGLLAQGFGLPWERADDLHAVLDDLLNDPEFGPVIDRTRIAAAGHSAGGETVIALAGGRYNRPALMAYCASPASHGDGTCEPRAAVKESIADIERLSQEDPAVAASLKRAHAYHGDTRVRAIFAMAPAMGPAFARDDLKSVTVPVDIVVGTDDDTAPMRANARRYATLIRGAHLEVLPGVRHLTFSSQCTAQGIAQLEGCRDGPGVDRTMVQQHVADAAFAFFESAWRRPATRLTSGGGRAPHVGGRHG